MRNCRYCNKITTRKGSTFCNRICYKAYMKQQGYKSIPVKMKINSVSIEANKKRSITQSGKKQSDEWIKNRSIALMGRISGMKGKKQSEYSRYLISIHNKGKHSSMCGVKNPNYKGGKSIFYTEYDGEFSEELKKKILMRDNFTCMKCYKRGWLVHHIDFNKLNCKENNLITVCKGCHMKIHNKDLYWFAKKTLSKDEFLKLFPKSRGLLNKTFQVKI